RLGGGPEDLFPCRFPLLPSIPFSSFSRCTGFCASRHFAPRALVTSCSCAAWTPAGEKRNSPAALRLLLLGYRSFRIMAPSLWKGLVGVGLFALAHAAFSAAQHRSYMRLTEKEDESLPIDIVLQTLLAFAVTCYGIVHIAGEFKDMDATSELKNKTFDTLRNHPSFYVFNHRGRVLFRPSDAPSSSNLDALSSNTSLKLRKFDSLRR
ncbi:ER membrane protein complex subunit 5, partial [Lemmus lemmus]